MSQARGQLSGMDSSERMLVELAEQQHGVFRMGQILDLGLGGRWRERRITDGRIVRVHDGSYRFAGTSLDWRGQLLAAVWAGGPRGRASHRSAAALSQLTGGRTDLTELTCARWRRARHGGLVVHETKAFDVEDLVVVDAIPCTTVARTLLDLGAVLRPAQVEYALDDALRRGLVTMDDLRALLRRVGARGRNGAGVLRDLVETRAPGSSAESAAERKMVRQLVQNGLPRPVLQFEVRDAGAFVARVDAAYPQWRIVVEYESYAHHVGRVALVRDNRRRNQVTRVGWHYLGVTAADLAEGCVSVSATIRALSRSVAA